MKSEVTMPAQARRRYTEEFKMEAVRLVRASAHPVAQVARDLGIPDNVLYRWRAQHRQAEELTRVKRELARVTQERNFLTRAAACFARESQ